MALQQLLTGARRHLTDSVALIAASTPGGALLENVVAGMSDDISLKTRFMIGGLYLAGLGGALGWGRDFSRRIFHITEKTKERYQQLHDMAYVAAVTLVLHPTLYFVAGSKEIKEIALATGFATVAAFATGGILGYSLDLFRDLTGYKSSTRIPEKIRNMPGKAKKAFAVAVFSASLGITGLIYYLTPDKTETIPPFPTQTETLEYYVNQELP